MRKKSTLRVDVAWQRLPVGSASYPKDIHISNILNELESCATNIKFPVANADPGFSKVTISFLYNFFLHPGFVHLADAYEILG